MSLDIEKWTRREPPAIPVEAVLLTEDNALQVAAWCRGVLVEEINPEDPLETQPGINVSARGGPRRASLGMYVVKHGPAFFVATVNVLESTYDPEVPPRGSDPAEHKRWR